MLQKYGFNDKTMFYTRPQAKLNSNYLSEPTIFVEESDKVIFCLMYLFYPSNALQVF